MSFDLSPNIWVDPLVGVVLLVSAYAPVKDFFGSRGRRAKARAEKDNERQERLDQLLADWHGQAARPGFPEIPGIPTRIYRIEHEIKHNGGGSIKDAVHRTDEAMAALQQEMAETREDVKGFQEKLEAK